MNFSPEKPYSDSGQVPHSGSCFRNLPPYSPCLSAFKECFSTLKGQVKKLLGPAAVQCSRGPETSEPWSGKSCWKLYSVFARYHSPKMFGLGATHSPFSPLPDEETHRTHCRQFKVNFDFKLGIWEFKFCCCNSHPFLCWLPFPSLWECQVLCPCGFTVVVVVCARCPVCILVCKNHMSWWRVWVVFSRLYFPLLRDGMSKDYRVNLFNIRPSRKNFG